jgi:hypothetical protein
MTLTEPAQYDEQIDRLEHLIDSAGLIIPERAELYRVRNFLVALLIENKHAAARNECPSCGSPLPTVQDGVMQNAQTGRRS